jgi:hypothetical protein
LVVQVGQMAAQLLMAVQSMITAMAEKVGQ